MILTVTVGVWNIGWVNLLVYIVHLQPPGELNWVKHLVAWWVTNNKLLNGDIQVGGVLNCLNINIISSAFLTIKDNI